MFLSVEVVLEDFEPVACVGKLYFDLEVEPTSSEQGLIDHLESICRAYDQYVLLRREPIHLREQLIDSRVLFTVGALVEDSRLLPVPNCVDLIDIDDRWRIFFCLFEEVSHSFGADTDIHLTEF